MKRLILLSVISVFLYWPLSGQPDRHTAPDEMEAILQQAEKGFMGIYAEMISETKAKKMGLEHSYGTLVVGVIPGTGAEKAGLQLFDYLYGIDAYRAGKEQNFGVILSRYKPGDQVRIYFIRKGESRTAELTFGKRPEVAEKKVMNKCEDTFLGITSNESVDPEEVDGVKINPLKNSTALELGLKDGDVIKTLNGYRMYDWDDIGYVLDNMKVGEKITVGFERDRKEMKGTAKIKSYADTKNCKDCDCSELEDMEFDIRVDIPEIRIEIPNLPKSPPAPAPPARADVSSMQVDIQDPATDEARLMNEKFNLRMSTDNNLPVKNIRLTANPGEGNFLLTFHLPQSGNTSVRIFNAKGRLIYEYDLGKFSGDFSDTVDISQNGPGTYYLDIRQGEQARLKKLVLSTL